MYYSPVRHFTQSPKEPFSFDLHVLGTPPALILSQDQTLQKRIVLRQLLIWGNAPYSVFKEQT